MQVQYSEKQRTFVVRNCGVLLQGLPVVQPVGTYNWSLGCWCDSKDD